MFHIGVSTAKWRPEILGLQYEHFAILSKFSIFFINNPDPKSLERGRNYGFNATKMIKVHK